MNGEEYVWENQSIKGLNQKGSFKMTYKTIMYPVEGSL